MARTVRALVAIDPALDVDSVAASVPDGEGVNVVGVIADLEEAIKRVEATPHDMLVVASSCYSERALLLVETANRLDRNRPVLVLSEGSTNGYVRRMLDAGADDILMLPQSRPQVAFAMRKVLASRDSSEGAEASRLIVVLGPKGGTGKTLTATNLAPALAAEGHAVTLVDLDLQFGDVGLTLGLAPEPTIVEVATRSGALDPELLSHFTVEHRSGARVLLAPNRPDHASAVTVELIRDVYTLLRATNEYIIVDTPPGFTAEVIATIDEADDLIMVGMLDALSLKNTKLGLQTLELMGVDPSHVRLVLNRAHSRVGISNSDVVAVLGREPDVMVPSDREIPRAVNEGEPIVLTRPESDAAAAFRQLASLFTGAPAGAPRSSARLRLFGKRG
jgi:pilus assembly protein CpaE